MEIVHHGEPHRHELYNRKDESSNRLDFVGIFSHNFEVREADDSRSPNNESLLKLQKDYDLLNEEKAAST